MNGQCERCVLIVDDDIDFVEQHRTMLEAEGFTVHGAHTRGEAEALMKEITPCVAILDLMMEEMDDGFVLAHTLKRKYPELPIIMVSGVTSETGIEFDAYGRNDWIKADAMLSKPIRFEQLKREIERLCR